VSGVADCLVPIAWCLSQNILVTNPPNPVNYGQS
jgi:hypothetical protein